MQKKVKTNEVQVSYMMFWARYQHIAKLSQSNIPDYTNSWIFHWLCAVFLTFAISLTFPGFQKLQKSGNPVYHLTECRRPSQRDENSHELVVVVAFLRGDHIILGLQSTYSMSAA